MLFAVVERIVAVVQGTVSVSHLWSSIEAATLAVGLDASVDYETQGCQQGYICREKMMQMSIIWLVTN